MHETVDYFFKATLSVLGAFLLYFVSGMKTEIQTMATNIADLNTNVAVVITQQENDRDKLKSLEKRLVQLELKGN